MGVRKKRTVLEPGMKGTHRFKGENLEMVVVKNGNKLGFKVNGKIFDTPTGAARSITKRPVSGWFFWNLDK